MKVVQSSILRAIIAIVVGILLIRYRNETVVWLVRCIGMLFFMSGLVSCVVYYVESKQAKSVATMHDADDHEIRLRKPFFPIVGLGSMILGAFLALLTDTFIVYTMYLLAAILILGAVNQFFNLARARQYSYVPFLYWVFPCVTLLVAILIIRKPYETSTLPLLTAGWCFIFYGVIETLNTFQIYRMRKAFEQQSQPLSPSQKDKEATIDEAEIEDAEIVE